MLRREDQLRRFDDDVQRRFAEAESTGERDWMMVATEIQEQVCKEFGVRLDQMRDGLFQLRQAALRNPDLAIYVRYNRCERGSFVNGDSCPDVTLRGMDGERRSLLAEQRDGRKLAILCGSYS